jgi:hypothetical protein
MKTPDRRSLRRKGGGGEVLMKRDRKRGSITGKRVLSILSTLPGKHGTSASETEVPLRTLLQALQNDTDLSNTSDKHDLPTGEISIKVELAV